MNPLYVVILFFAILGGADRILGNRFGLGAEFEKGMMLFGTMANSMIGMIVLAPVIADFLSPVSGFAANVLGLDPSIVPAIILANDMGGAQVSVAVANDPAMGSFNALVVAAMMGATISYSVPVSMGLVHKEYHRQLILGLLCGIVTIPVGCFAGGLTCGLSIGALLWNLVPLTICSLVISAGLLLFPDICVKVFNAFGVFLKMLITVGLVLGIAEFLLGVEFIPALEPVSAGVEICFNACVVMTGAFPMVKILSKVLEKPLKVLGGQMGIEEVSAVGFILTLATSTMTFGVMNQMDKKGIMLNAAFAVSAAYTFGSHLAFTMAFDERYLLPSSVAKLVAGVLALVLAYLLYGRLEKMAEHK